jgi:LuxR family maltose regulon positive regulatory protein
MDIEMTARILLVDDHPIFRKGLHTLLDDEEGLRIVGEAANGREAIELVKNLSPNVVIMDITMPELDGIEATLGILAESPETKVIALSIHGGKRFVESMLSAGAVGYILKDSVPEELVDGVRTVLRGETYICPEVSGLVIAQYVELLSRVQASGGPAELTRQETAFIRLLGEGCSEEEIAASLRIEDTAVNVLQDGVLKKLNLSTVAELVEYAGAKKWFAGQEEIERAIRHAASSKTTTRQPPKPQPLIEPLTNRELDILELLAQRFYNKEIADRLCVSVETVKTHLKNIFQKFGVTNRRDAIDKSRKLGLLDSE